MKPHSLCNKKEIGGEKKKMKNEKRSIRKDERAVSPVIGVILMVAITVILAAVIAAFVFGYGAPAAAPQASMRIIEAEASSNTITIEHTGGDGVVLADTQVLVTPDATAPGTYVNQGNLTAPSVNIGTSAIFEPGEISTETVGSGGLTTGNTCKVTIIHSPSGQQVFSAIATVTA